MKYIIPISALFLLVCIGCGNNTTKPIAEPSIKKDSIAIGSDDTPAKFENQFSIEKIHAFGDSLIAYFRNEAKYNIKSYETTIDTVKTDAYQKITITLRTNTYKTNGLISYDIFTFQTPGEASDFYNDLKTQELVVLFGINKRPNHILVDSNRVFWHHLEHPYGHRIKDLTQIFNQTFNFHPNSSNLDSVSGFTYCRCKNEDTDIKGMIGKWETTEPIAIWNDKYMDEIESHCANFISGKTDFQLTHDAIVIHGNSTKIEVTSSINLPNSGLFWKYHFQFTEEMENEKFNTEFQKKLERLSAQKDKLTVYEIKLTNHCYISFVKPDKGSTYMMVDDRFYELKKI